MIRRLKLAPVFFLLSLVFALFSLPFSGAISEGRLERKTTADVVADSNAVLKLEGFHNQLNNLDNKYKSIGTIKNNSNQTLRLIISIRPNFLLVSGNNYKYNIKIGNQTVQFDKKSNLIQQMTITLNPGQETNVLATLMNNNLGMVFTSFYFTAGDLTGTFLMNLNDTLRTPRQIICY